MGKTNKMEKILSDLQRNKTQALGTLQPTGMLYRVKIVHWLVAVDSGNHLEERFFLSSSVDEKIIVGFVTKVEGAMKNGFGDVCRCV
jgi:hypothetical protein